MCERARALLESGVALEAMAPPRLRVQLALYRLGGIAILDSIAAAGYRTAARRPTVDRVRRVRLAATALVATATSVKRYNTERTRPGGGGGRSANLGASEERENLFARRASGQAEQIVRLPPRAAPQSPVTAQPAGDKRA
jgi:hypothetical protein